MNELNITYHDFRDDNEKRIEKDALAGKSYGKEYDAYVNELVQIGKEDGFRSSERTGKFNSSRKHIRVLEIGEELDSKGGFDLMLKVFHGVKANLTNPVDWNHSTSGLENCWGNIGNWQS